MLSSFPAPSLAVLLSSSIGCSQSCLTENELSIPYRQSNLVFLKKEQMQASKPASWIVPSVGQNENIGFLQYYDLLVTMLNKLGFHQILVAGFEL
jgi:hypothetical protein